MIFADTFLLSSRIIIIIPCLWRFLDSYVRQISLFGGDDCDSICQESTKISCHGILSTTIYEWVRPAASSRLGSTSFSAAHVWSSCTLSTSPACALGERVSLLFCLFSLSFQKSLMRSSVLPSKSKKAILSSRSTPLPLLVGNLHFRHQAINRL